MNSIKHADYDKADENIVTKIKDFGWSVIMIEATSYNPAFAYTVGLWKSYNHPEVISFGLTLKTLHSILNIAGESAKNGVQLETYKNHDNFFESGDAQLIPVDKKNLKDYFGYAMWYNETTDFPALQLVWTDRKNQFPWDNNYEAEFEYRQPLLDRYAHFKFRESAQLGIFTTRQWLEENKPILRVVHDTDGDWQFLTNDQYADDMRLVCLNDMVLKDDTLNGLFNLDYGEQAERESINHPWKRSEVKEEEEEDSE